ncbi:hypothetical protein RI054_43g152080 [Pseudoscourfieldia marina]
MVVADDEHAQDTDVNLTTTVRYPEDSQRESRWDDIKETHVDMLTVNRLLPGEMLALAEALTSETCTLHTLYLVGNEVSDDDARALAKALRSDKCKLHELYLDVNEVRDDGARALAEALRSDTCTLHTLNLHYNRVGPEGARALAEALRSETCYLHTLHLGSNNVGADGERALAEAQGISRERRRCRHRGLLRAIVRLAILHKRACEVVFHPKRLRREGVFDAWAHDG